MGCVRTVVSTDNDCAVGLGRQKGLGCGLILVGGVAKGVARIGEMAVDSVDTISVDQGLANPIRNRLRFRRQHCRLVDNSKSHEVGAGVEGPRGLGGEPLRETIGTLRSFDDGRKPFGLLHVSNDNRRRPRPAVREGRLRLFMCGFAVNDHGILPLAKLPRAIPDLFDKGARCVPLIGVDAPFRQPLCSLKRRAECRNDHDVIGRQVVPRDELLSIGIHDEADSPLPQIFIDMGIVDHFREKEDSLLRIHRERSIGDLDSILDAEAEAEMACDLQAKWTQIEHGGGEVASTWIRELSRLLDSGDDGRSVVDGDVEASHSGENGAQAIKVPTPKLRIPADRFHHDALKVAVTARSLR